MRIETAMVGRCKQLFGSIIAIVAILGTGCATPTVSPDATNTIIILPGIGGDGGVYAQVIDSLRASGSRDCLRVLNWGDGWLFFPITIASSGLHQETEEKLTGQIVQWRVAHPGSRVVLIGHSAGAGVVLGALARLKNPEAIGPIILLAPALSPDFDLRPSLQHATIIHVFYSPEDSFWQGFGPSLFGNYDGSHRDGAGKRGFSLNNLDDIERLKVVQHPYQKKWDCLGATGGHFDWLAKPFVARVLRPIIEESGQPVSATRPSVGADVGIGRSSAASRP